MALRSIRKPHWIIITLAIKVRCAEKAADTVRRPWLGCGSSLAWDNDGAVELTDEARVKQPCISNVNTGFVASWPRRKVRAPERAARPRIESDRGGTSAQRYPISPDAIGGDGLGEVLVRS